METRKCNLCQQELPVDQFHLDKSDQKFGRQHRCKECCRVRQKRYADRMAKRRLEEQGLKICYGCSIQRHASEFHRNNAYKDGWDRKCKQCRREYQQSRREHLAMYAKRKRLEDKYNLSLAEHLALLKAQNNCCAICGIQLDMKFKPCVDHNHTTGVVRGILCANCNSGIGLLKDAIALVRKAAAYLESRANL